MPHVHVTPGSSLPRLIVYHQTTHQDGNDVSLLPLIQQPSIAVTHVIIAAVHINENPNGLTLNNHRPTDPRFDTLWSDVHSLQQRGITVMCMLGGAAQGSFTRLDGDQASFEAYYKPLQRLISDRALQGIDLDVEEPMSLQGHGKEPGGIVRLIDRLRADFGPGFLITLAPVAAALLSPANNMSGFDYKELEGLRSSQIAWYNAQFYNGWGDASDSDMYAACVQRGWLPERLVMGLLTANENGNGFVHIDRLRSKSFPIIKSMFPTFGGVMGWEYFNSHPGGTAAPWEWAQNMSRILKGTVAQRPRAPPRRTGSIRYATREIDPDMTAGDEPGVPDEFGYDSDGLDGRK